MGITSFVIDGHVHCGPRKFNATGGFGYDSRSAENQVSNTFIELKSSLAEAGVNGAVLLPFPEDIQRPGYSSPESAQAAHEYILDIAKNNEYFYPFYFVWQDFMIPDDMNRFRGIKWHRHFWSDPEYDYEDPRCDAFVEEMRKYNLPVILEDSFENTLLFISKYPDIKVIIPHIGMANGGARNIVPEFKDNPNVYIETSLAYPFQISTAIHKFGVDRVIFGSDTPYSSTKIELFKLFEYDLLQRLSQEDLEKILFGNMLKLMGIERPSISTKFI
jgi:predicted TIM-barrel fold metal-dependent hydrolase